MSNQLSTSQLVANISLAEFQNNLTFLMTADKGYQAEFHQAEYQTGDTVNIRTQNHFIVSDGDIVNEQDVIETTIPLVVNHLYSIMIPFSARELSLDVDPKLERFKMRYIDPAVRDIVNQMETQIAEDATFQLNYMIGTAGTPLNSFPAINAARTKLMNMAVNPADRLYQCLSLTDSSAVQNSLQNSFNEILNKDISQEALIARLAKFDMFESQLIKVHTTGSLAGAPVTSAAVTSGSSIPFSGATPTTSQVFRKGDVIYVAGVNAVNPISRTSYGDLMQFVVTADVDSDGAGTGTIPIYPSIISDVGNPRRNVSAPIPNATAISIYGVTVAGTPVSYRNNIAYGSRALAIACPPLTPLYSREGAVSTDPQTGTSIRVEYGSDMKVNRNYMRFSVLCGWRWFDQYALRNIG